MVKLGRNKTAAIYTCTWGCFIIYDTMGLRDALLGVDKIVFICAKVTIERITIITITFYSYKFCPVSSLHLFQVSSQHETPYFDTLAQLPFRGHWRTILLAWMRFDHLE